MHLEASKSDKMKIRAVNYIVLKYTCDFETFKKLFNILKQKRVRNHGSNVCFWKSSPI